MHRKLRAAILGVEERGQRGDEGLVIAGAEHRSQLVAEAGQPREIRRGDPGQDGGMAMIGEHAPLPAQQLIADNLRGEPGRAEDLFTRALAACRPGPDDNVASEALRHLGGTAQAAGDLALARQRWERSAGLAQRAGWLPLALAQQALLAELAAEEGDKAGARALAREVRRWATALGLSRLESQAAAIDSGQ